MIQARVTGDSTQNYTANSSMSDVGDKYTVAIYDSSRIFDSLTPRLRTGLYADTVYDG